MPGRDAIEVGIVEGANVYNVNAIVDALPTLRWPFPPGDQFISHLDQLRPQLEMLRRNALPVPLANVILKPPIANPGKLLCGVGNYSPIKPAKHDPRALGLLFKMTSATAGAGDGVTIRWLDRDTSHEMEIAIIIGRTGTLISADNALSYVAGYAIGLDMTMQGKEFPSFCKSFDSYGVIGPWMITADEIPDPSKLSFCLKVNGKIRQQQALSELLLSVPELIEHISSVMTLYPGDIIFSGTPPWSVAPVVPGDVMHAQIDVIGEMTVLVHEGKPGRQPTY